MPSSYVIGEHFELFVREQIQSGRYASASEVVRDGLRALEDRERWREARLQALRGDIQRGADSGEALSPETAFEEVRKRISGLKTAARVRR